ncbi:MAG: 1-deoxy-D-xylulose-5-phosphate reductoisomerase, partial [Paracoccaceae bacterium]
LRLARDVMARRGLSGAVFNAAKERALDAFIARRIGFLQMAEVVEEVLHRLSADIPLRDGAMTLELVGHVDHLSRDMADQVIHQIQNRG